jgi:predicted alpha/beta-hydrolase family hydrolase
MESAIQTERVRGVLHEPEAPNGNAILLTHGAGSNANAPLLLALARDFVAAGYLVLRYDLPFRFGSSKGPLNEAQQSRDREGVRDAIAAVRERVKGTIIVGGHSYGGRQTAMMAAEHPDAAAGLLLLSYPLHPPEKPQQLRTAFFPQLRTPALFVHGTRDPYGTPDEVRDAVKAIPAHTEILVVDRAGHDLKAAARMGGTILDRLRLISS